MQTNEIKKESISNPSKVITFSRQQQKKEKDHDDTDSDMEESDLLAQPITNKNQLLHPRLLTENSYLKLLSHPIKKSSQKLIEQKTNPSICFSKVKKLKFLLIHRQIVKVSVLKQNKQIGLSCIKELDNCKINIANLWSITYSNLKDLTKLNDLLQKLLYINYNHRTIMKSQSYQFITFGIPLQFKKNSLHDCCKASNWGTFGSVYFIKSFESELAVKCIKISKKQRFNPQSQYFCETNLSSHLIAVIKEYFFLLFFSELEVGPKVKTIGGFDIVFYQSCIQFSTEICLAPEKDSMKNQLSQSLFSMHMFQVVHRDIKPPNIMYSPTFRKTVFIDFGCTQILNQKIGQKTITQFIGTSAFCTDEVVNLLQKKKGAVDLYYNDLYGLNASLAKIEKSQKMNKSIHKVIESGYYINIPKSYDFLLYSLKHSLYFENFVQFYNLWRVIKIKFYQEIEQIQLKLLSFFSQLKPNQHLAQFYWTQIDETIRNLPSYQWLKIIFKVRPNEFVLLMMRIPQKTKILALNQMTYRVLHVQNSQSTKNQIQIEKILINSLKVKDKIYQMIQNLKINQSSEKIFQQNSKKLDKLCTIVAFYSSFSSNKFNSSIDQKIRVCQNTLSIIKKLQNIDFDEMLVFNTPFKQLSSIVMFYHYFIFKVWRRVPQKFKSSSMIAGFITFCLLGYPISNNFAAGKLTKAFVQVNLLEEQNNKLSFRSHFKNSLFYFECKFLVFLCGLMFCKGNTLNNANLERLFLDKINYDQDQMHDNDSDFQEINAFNSQLIHYFQSKCFENTNTGLNLDRIVKQINSQKFKTLSKKYEVVNKWKTLVQITVDEFSFFHAKTNVLNTSRYLSQNSTMLNQYKNSIILPFISLYGKASNTMTVKSLSFQRVDEIIGLKQISINFRIRQRLSMALENKNIKFLTQIADYFECKTVQRLQFHMLLILDEIIGQIVYFIRYRCFQLGVAFHSQNIRILKQIFRIYIFILKTGYDNFQLINQFFYNKLKTIDHPISADLIDLGIQNDRLNRDFLFYILYIGNFFINVRSEIPKKFVLTENIKIQIEQKYLIFMNHIKSNPTIFFLTYQWSKLIQENCHLRKMFFQCKSLSNNLLSFFFLQRSIVSQISDMHKILKIDKVIEFLYKKIEAKMFYDQQNWNNVLRLDMAFEYYQSKLFHSNYETCWCEEIIQLYKICNKRNLLDYVFGKVGVIRNIHNSLVYLQKKPVQFEDFFFALTSNISKSPNIDKIELLSRYLYECFWCTCKNCYTRKPQFWDPNRVFKHMYQNIDLRYVAVNPEMSLVYYFSMINKKLKVDENYRKVIKYILKSIPYLTQSVRNNLLPRIYLFVFIISNPELTTNEILFTPPRLSIEQSQKKRYRQFIRYSLKYFKNKDAPRDSLEQSVQQTFFRQKLIENYKIPNFARKQYAKKLRKYYQMKESYQKSRNINYELKFSINLDFLPY